MSEKKLLIRNALIFQLKLGLDAVRDILLSPIAFISVLIDLLSGNHGTNSYFYRLMNWGRFSDKWIALFEIEAELKENTSNKPSVDSLIAQIETSFKEKTLTEASKNKLQHCLNNLLKNKTSETNSPPEDINH